MNQAVTVGTVKTIEPTLRELRRERARSEIATTAIALFQEHGYEATTVEQIANAALVSPRTFYNYFSSKEDVLFYEVDAGTDAFRSQVIADSRTVGPFNAVRTACLAIAEHIDSQAGVDLPRLKLIASVATLEARDRRTDRAFVEVISAAISTTTGRSRSARRHARLIGAATIGGLNEAVNVWVDGDGQPALQSIVDELLQALEPLYPTSAAVED